MDAAKSMAIINHIEDNFPVDEWEVFGLQVWPLIRFQLGFYLRTLAFDNNNETCKPVKKHSKVVKITSIIKSLLNELKIYLIDFKNNDTLRKKVEVVFFIQSPTININEHWLDTTQPYIDECKKLNLKTLLIQLNPIDYLNIPRKNKSALIKSTIILREKFSSIIFELQRRKLLNDSNYNLKDYEQFLDYCINNNILHDQFVLERLLKSVYTINALKQLFIKKLKPMQPDVCFKICYYDDKGMALNLACRKLGITFVDLQHGIQGPYHFAYGRWRKIPVDGYDLLPDYFWCWGEREARAIESWNYNVQDRHKSFIGGNLWLDTWLKNLNDEFNAFNETVEGRLKQMDNSIVILYTMQPSEPVLDWFYEAINRSPKEWQWLVRLHPAMLNELKTIKQEFAQKCTKRVEIDVATSSPLPALLRKVDIHVTSCSTVVLEALEFKVPSIIISDTGNNYYHDLIEAGWAVSVSSSDELIEEIDRLVRGKRDLGSISHSKPNSEQSIKKFFALIKGEKQFY